MNKSYIVIPIFSDPFLHPLHKDNGLSLLYVQEIGKESTMLCQFHPDCVGVLEDYKWLENEEITSLSKVNTKSPQEKNCLNLFLFHYQK